MIRQIPVGEKATVLASLAYIIALAFYKHWLRSQYDVMNGSLIERAFATAGKPWYWFFLLTGFAFIILLVCMGVHLFRIDMGKPGNLVGVISRMAVAFAVPATSMPAAKVATAVLAAAIVRTTCRIVEPRVGLLFLPISSPLIGRIFCRQ